MNKPISMIKEEFESKLIEVVNSCELPACIIEAIIKSVYLEVKDLSKKSAEIERAKYNEEIAKQTKQEVKEVNTDEEEHNRSHKEEM